MQGRNRERRQEPFEEIAALDAHATRINDAMKIAAAKEIAARAPEGELTPPILDRELHAAVAAAVREAALTTGDVRHSQRLEV